MQCAKAHNHGVRKACRRLRVVTAEANSPGKPDRMASNMPSEGRHLSVSVRMLWEGPCVAQSSFGFNCRFMSWGVRKSVALPDAILLVFSF
mmetsp:Transcript_11455/g.23726  ORF Transcript_11455/g.23726 Transcript_11455/m.23726 type:complete len:91 (+) Transcript_11455:178-450(+)